MRSLAPEDPDAARLRKRSRGGAIYDDFFELQPLVDYMLDGASKDMSGVVLRDKLLVAIRCTTLARSADVAKMLPMLYHDGTRRYLRFLDKQNRNRLLAINGRTYHLFVNYFTHISTHPQLFLFRLSSNSGRCLGSERLAKLMLKTMAAVGIDTAA